MTDGQPTAGDLVDADVLLSWFRERNRLARLRLHVVTFETIDVDLKFLHALADENALQSEIARSVAKTEPGLHHLAEVGRVQRDNADALLLARQSVPFGEQRESARGVHDPGEIRHGADPGAGAREA